MLNLGVYGGSYFGRNLIILNDLPQSSFIGISPNKYKNWDYNQAINYFNVTPFRTDRTFDMPSDLKQLHKLGWFEWYISFYYGLSTPADKDRMQQWLVQINTDWFYIKNSAYSGSGDRITDLTFLPQRRQRLLEFAADPTIDPSTYGCSYKF